MIKHIMFNPFQENTVAFAPVTSISENWIKTYMDIAQIMSKNSHCISHKVACIIVKDGRIISTGINGTPKGGINCDEHFLNQLNALELHHEWSEKNELHAEINALMIAAKNGISVLDTSAYCTLSPCIHCAKALVAAGIREVFFETLYDKDQEGIKFLLSYNIKVYQYVREVE